MLIACLAAWSRSPRSVAVLSAARAGRRPAWLALSFAYLPLLLLVGAAIEPGGLAEGLIVAVGCGSLAALTLRLFRGWSALAVACAIVGARLRDRRRRGIWTDELSLLGPNPGFGVRFYGIGNELEALFAVMVPVGVGAALQRSTAAGEGR